MTNDELHQVDSDLAMALEYNNNANLPSPVAEILATIVGKNDFAAWHWIVRLEDGRFAYITGSCDYTGWDCRSDCESFVADDIPGALAQVGEAERDELTAKVARHQGGG